MSRSLEDLKGRLGIGKPANKSVPGPITITTHSKDLKSVTTADLEKLLEASRKRDIEVLRLQNIVNRFTRDEAKILYDILHDKFHGED